MLNRLLNQRYSKERDLGSGTYGTVFQAEDKESGTRVAIKRIKPQERDGSVDFSALREIRLMQELRHPHILHLRDVFVHESAIHLVLELLATDLEQLVQNRSLQLNAGDIKSLVQMSLQGLEFCHRHWILHRDLKPANIMLSEGGQVKIMDFGLARSYGTHEPMSPEAMTLWYKAPELLFGAREYGSAVDIWSMGASSSSSPHLRFSHLSPICPPGVPEPAPTVNWEVRSSDLVRTVSILTMRGPASLLHASGCIFAELWWAPHQTPAAIFPGAHNEIDQLSKIFKFLGTPTPESWPGVDQLLGFVEFQECNPASWDQLLPPEVFVPFSRRVQPSPCASRDSPRSAQFRQISTLRPLPSCLACCSLTRTKDSILLRPLPMHTSRHSLSRQRHLNYRYSRVGVHDT